MDDAPVAVLLMKGHRRARDEVFVLVALGRPRIGPDPADLGVPLAPDHRDVRTDHAADVEGDPGAGVHVLLVVFPQRHPMVAAMIGVTIEIEERRLGCGAPDLVLQPLPIENRVRVEIGLKLREHPFSVAFGSAHQFRFAHRDASPSAQLRLQIPSQYLSLIHI